MRVSSIRQSGRWTVFLAMVVCSQICTAGASRMVPISSESPGGPDGPMPLVTCYGDLVEHIKQAEAFIEQQDYGRAIGILQAIVLRRDSGFASTSDGRRYVSLSLMAHKMLGRMGPKGLKLYRRLYDPQARRLYETALRESDAALLRRVIRNYIHTTFGPKSLEALAAVCFDEGKFAQAGRCWRRFLEIPHDRRTREASGLLLAKIAAAYHLGGESASSDDAFEILKSRYADVSAELGGRRRNIVRFVRDVREAPPLETTRAVGSGRGFPGLGGLPGGMGLMDDCDVVLVPQWRRPDRTLRGGRDSTARLIGGRIDAGHYTRRSDMVSRAKVENGYVRIEQRYGRTKRSYVCPSLIHPVVAKEKVIYRTDENVVACDIVTGETSWVSLNLPVWKKVNINYNPRWRSSPLAQVHEAGRYALTVGDDKVFATCDTSADVVTRPGMHPSKICEPDRGALAALSLDAQGTLLWTVGNGRGDDPALRHCKFLTAPTYDDGRLYAVVMHLRCYWMVCMDAETGGLIWKEVFSEIPIIDNTARYSLPYLLSRGSPSAVSDGRVFAVSNAGVIAAFDADSGQAIWAYQYDGDVVGSWGRYRHPSVRPGARSMPPNPVIITGGLVICLPADSDKVIALSVDDGREVWKVDRCGQADLTALDEDRVLLSGGGLVVLSAADGSSLFDAGEDKGITGRPSASRSAVLACGDEGGVGNVFRLDLNTYNLTAIELASRTALLGNLVSADGKLIAANTAGVCGYMKYDVAREEMDARIRSAPPRARPELVFRKARLAFNTRRFSDALADLQECSRLIERCGDDPKIAALDNRTVSWFRRTYVALGNAAGTDRQMLAMFRQAEKYADTPQAKALVKICLMKYHARAGEPAAAVALAQQISEKHGREQLVDIEIGARANPVGRFEPGGRCVRGKVLAQRFIKKLIAAHGQKVFAEFDALAAEELEKARDLDDADAMIAVARRWPNSVWANRSLFAAAEVHYRNGTSPGGSQAEESLGKAAGLLASVAYDSSNASLRLSARTGEAAIWARSGNWAMVKLCCDEIPESRMDTQVAFADINGKLRDVLARLRATKLTGPPVVAAFVSSIAPPLNRIYAIRDGLVQILRDQHYRPVRIGQKVFAIKGDRAVMLDTAAADPNMATGWCGLTSVNVETIRKKSSLPPSRRIVAALSKDRETFVVADTVSVAAFEMASAKRIWEKKIADLGVGPVRCLGVGRDVLVVVGVSGRIACISTAGRGEVLWKAGVGRGRVDPPQVNDHAVLVSGNNGHTLTCFSKKTGEVIARWKDRGNLDGAITPEGFLVVLNGGELSARRIDQPDKPLWTAQLNAISGPAILDVSGEYVVISPSRSSNVVKVLSIANNGKEVASFALTRLGSSRAIPVAAVLRAKSLYLICTPGHDRYRQQNRGRRRGCRTRGIGIQKYDLGENRIVWNLNIDENGSNWYFAWPLVLGQKHLVATLKHGNTEDDPNAYVIDVIDVGTGRIVEQITPPKDAENAEEAVALPIGPAVMTDGRLCVETSEGVVVYGGQ